MNALNLGLLSGVLFLSASQSAPDQEKASRLFLHLKPFFQAPSELAGDLKSYKSPMIREDGTTVKTPAEWAAHRQEILKTWHEALGAWPELIEKPSMKVLGKEMREGILQEHVRLGLAPGRTTEDAYLLTPPGPGPFPAMVVVFYEAKTAIGLSDKPFRDFAIQLAKRGFVALSLGGDPNTYYPDKANAIIQPLSFHAYEAANCYNLLAHIPNVDPRRIGIVGHSYGGKWALLASCMYDKFACAAWSDPGIVFDETRPSVNYWEQWYMGYEKGRDRKPGVPSTKHPRTGSYKKLVEDGHDLHELHVLMAPRPFLVSGGSEDRAERWKPLNHSIEVNKLLGYTNRVAMTNRDVHPPSHESNEQIYQFFEYFLKYGKALEKPERVK
jgi:dienelactone hydrolase